MPTHPEFLYRIDEFLWKAELLELVKFADTFTELSDLYFCEAEVLEAVLSWTVKSDPGLRRKGLVCLSSVSFGRPKTLDFFSDGPQLISTIREQNVLLKSVESFSSMFTSLEYVITEAIQFTELNTPRKATSPRTPEESEISREFRLILNCIFIYVLSSFQDTEFMDSLYHARIKRSSTSSCFSSVTLSSLLTDCFRLIPDNHLVPVKKLLLLMQLLCMFRIPVPISDLYLENFSLSDSLPSLKVSDESSSTDHLLRCFPLNHPKLRNFRTFVFLAKHQHSLVLKFGGRRPAAIREALDLIKERMEFFYESYPLHYIEEVYIRTEPTMHEAFMIYVDLKISGKLCPTRRHAIPISKTSELDRFSFNELGKSLLSNWKFQDASEKNRACQDYHNEDENEQEYDVRDETSESESCGSESEDESGKSALRKLLLSLKDKDHHLKASDFEMVDNILRQAKSDYFQVDSNDDDNQNTRNFQNQFSTETQNSLFSLFGFSLKEILVSLLRLLLSSSKNSQEFPHTVLLDLDKQMLMTLLLFEKVPGSDVLRLQESMESKRNESIIAATVTGLLVRILKNSMREDSLLFASLLQSFSNSNGCLVILKYLNNIDDSGENILSDLSTAVLPCLQENPISEINNFSSTRMDKSVFCAVPNWRSTAILRALKILYVCCKNSPERIRKFLIGYKSSLIFRKLLRIPSCRIQRLALRLFRCQLKYFHKKTRMQQLKVVSSSYLVDEVDFIDDLLLINNSSTSTGGGIENEDRDGGENILVSLENSESCFEVRVSNDECEFYLTNEMARIQEEEENFLIFPYNGVKWDDDEDAKAFCSSTGISLAECFFGYDSLEDFIEQGIFAASKYTRLGNN